MRSFGLVPHYCRKATLCPPSLVLGRHARMRPHHSIGEGQCAEGSTRVENRECCLVRRSWAFCITNLVSRLPSQLFQQDLRLLEVRGVKAFREPAIDRRQ